MYNYFKLFTCLFICLFMLSSMASANSDFTDPNGKFMLSIPSGWIYHAYESRSDLLVFYGSGNEQILYIESFAETANHSPKTFAERVVELFGSNYGIKDFKLIVDPQAIKLDQLEVFETIYSYLGTNPRIEHRIFVIHQDWGLTITYSDSAHDYHNNSDEFELILQGWVWLEEDS